MRRLLIRSLPIFILLLLVSIPAYHTLAQDPPTSVYWDFRTSAHGAVIHSWDAPADSYVNSFCGTSFTSYPLPDGSYSGGFGFRNDPSTFNASPHCEAAGVEIQLPDSDLLNNATMTSFVVYISGSALNYRDYLSSSGASLWDEPIDDESCATLSQADRCNGSGALGKRLAWEDSGGSPITDLRNLIIPILSYGGDIEINGIEFSYTTPNPGGLTMPIASADQHPQWGMFDYQYVQENDLSIPEGDTISDFPNTVYAFSNTAEAKVSAVAAGTVMSVTPYTGADCSGAFVILQTLRRCRIFVPQYIAQESGSLVFNIELVNLSTIVIEDADNPDITYTYWLADAEVSVGSEVVAGCVLGKTVQLLNPTSIEFTAFNIGASGSLGASGEAGVSVNAGISGSFRSLLVDAGVTTVVENDTGDPVQLFPNLTEEPDYSNCQSATFTNCTLTNPTLKADRNGITIDGWGTGQASPIPGGGVHLLRGGLLKQSDVVIRPDIGYTLSVMARVTTPIDSFYPIVLQVGSATTTKNITEGDYQLVTWALTAREVSVTDVSVINSLDTLTNAEHPPEVDVLKVCLAPDTATVAPGACYFPDHSFDANGQGWTSTGDVNFVAGQVFMGDSSTLSYEDADLLTNTDDTPATYHLKALVRLNASSSFTGQEDKSIELKYGFPSEDGYSSLGVIDSALVESEGRNAYDGSINIEHVYTLTQDITISTNTEGTFSFGVLITDTDGYIKGLRIDSLCLTSDTADGSFPGQGGPFVPPFIEQCATVPTPIDNNISSWTYYHWKNLERFFNCTLMVKLNAMYKLMNDAWTTTRLFLRWMVVGTNRIGDWFTTFVWWLGGHLRNIAIGQVTTVYQSGGSCNDLFCVLNNLITGILTPLNNIVNTLLGYVSAGINLLLTLVIGFIGVGLALLQRLFGLFNQVTGLFTGIIGAYSTATPATISGLPTCSIDPTSSPFCRATWVLDNTILGGRWAVLLTIILGIASIHLILWVIGEFRAAIISAGSSL